MKILPFLLLIAWSLISCAQDGKLILVNSGKTAYRIVVPARGTAVETHAANEIQHYLEKISGTSIPIVKDITPAIPTEICIGKTNRGSSSIADPDGLSIETKGNSILISGGNRKGTLYGVYVFLETFFNCHYLAKGVEVIPTNKVLAVPALINVQQNPAISFRSPLFYFSEKDTLMRKFADWNKIQYVYEFRGSLAHTFEVLLPPAKYFKQHPEYYALVDGVRKPTQPCLSQPEVFNIMLTNLKADMAKNQNFKNWSISQNDNRDYCHCNLCEPKHIRENSYMGTLLPFVNRFAAAFPNMTISTLAYNQSINPPVTLKPAKNVEIFFCVTEVDRGRPINTSNDQHAAALKNTMAGWKKLAKEIFVWDYPINYFHTLCPWPNYQTLQPNIQFFKANNVTGLFEQGVIYQKGEFSELRVYLLSRLMWDPNLNFNKVRDEFLTGFYGPAKDDIVRYMDLLVAEYQKSGIALTPWQQPDVFRNSYLSQQNLDKYHNIFRHAETVTANSPYYSRVVQERLAVDYAELEMKRTAPTSALARGVTANNDELKQFVADCDKFGITWLGNEEKSARDFQQSFGNK
ncbi:protein of unknown function [Chitinophaga jiangningensis]|uniref:Glycosyl hydrolase family 67 N-terminus n=1 Tax=Chitinophaga jiangningensis TaxID=1419482 RepID=A0A1M7HHL8_9BACT|nr:DUF4838 domain-containing protein [Chitinophaga jiangningensis]SHM27982.1 protein of unknown function [Chitinophaga jiangningensis]